MTRFSHDEVESGPEGDGRMKRSRYTEAQIIGILKEQEAGTSIAGLCRKHGMSDATFYTCKSKYGGLEVSEAKRLRALEADKRQGRYLHPLPILLRDETNCHSLK